MKEASPTRSGPNEVVYMQCPQGPVGDRTWAGGARDGEARTGGLGGAGRDVGSRAAALKAGRESWLRSCCKCVSNEVPPLSSSLFHSLDRGGTSQSSLFIF